MNQIIKLVDDPTVVGLIHRSEESMYRKEVSTSRAGAEKIVWCSMRTNRRRWLSTSGGHSPSTLLSASVERVENIKFLRVQISQDLSWNKNTSGIMKCAQQRLYFLRKLSQASLPISILGTFYSDVVESALMYGISTWYSSCSMSDKEALQRIVRGAERFIWVSLPSVQGLFHSGCRSRALNTIRDASHPRHTFFELLPSGKQFRSQKGPN